MQEKHILEVTLSGVFFYPADGLAGLEGCLAGAALRDAEDAFERFYRLNDVESPRVTLRDLIAALETAVTPG